MIIPAILRKTEIIHEFQKLQYTDDLMYLAACLDNYVPDIIESPDESTFQYAIVNSKDKLIGFVEYKIRWYDSQALNFGLMSFDRGNPLVGKEIFNIMNNIINNMHIHRIEWAMISGNPVENSYDKLCNKYNGRKIILRDKFKDRLGNYHDTILYEIINDNH